MVNKQSSGPQFVRFFTPIIEALRELGGSARTAEVVDLAIEKLSIPEDEQGELLESGASRVRNQAQWARLYLVHAGLLSSSKRGVWALTDSGRASSLNGEGAIELFRKVAKDFRQERQAKKTEASPREEETDSPDAQEELPLLETIQSLPPIGFERLCQRLLREAGFQQVHVTVRSGDGGIDGYGILEVNPLVSFNVLFQCKRYRGSVGTAVIRDFRGAMMGRADKGIVLTTGTFTTDAKKEARRDGAPPIELVDGEKLVHMFQELELGVIAKTVYEVDHAFFGEFREDT